jgi:transcriptional regulator GlxA family with amidase domain
MKKIVFIIPPTVELLDLAGPVQVFTEAKFYGHELDLEFYLFSEDPVSTSGLTFGRIANYTQAQLKQGDFVFIPGMEQGYIRSTSFKREKIFFKWLKDCAEKKINICSVCNGAFALGQAGLLNDLDCTTHWRRVDELQEQFPKTNVLSDVFFVKNGHICTSAGISAGIDLALSILEDFAGTHFAQRVARGLVVYYRGNGSRKRRANYLDFRNHINMKIHAVQDYLLDHMSGETSNTKLASIAEMSPRNLTRVFRDTTGTTINNYLTMIRVDKAKALIKDPKKSMRSIALTCGFKTERQLQRILKKDSKE